MSLADRLESAKKRPHPLAGCTVGKLTRDLPPDDAAALREALADVTVRGTWLSEALAAEGHEIPGGTIQAHRRRVCQCEQAGLA